MAGMEHSDAHPGFDAVAAHVAQHEGVSEESARAIIAHAAIHASESAKKKNPRLKRVAAHLGKPKGH